MRKTTVILLTSLFAYFGFVGMAVAGNTVSPDDGNFMEFLKPVYEAVMHGQWWVAASGALVLAVVAMNRYFPSKKVRDWMHGDYGKPLSILLMSFGGALGTALLGPGAAAISLALAWTAAKIAVTAAGGYSLLKALAVPFLTKFGPKFPAFLKPLADAALWFFSKPTAVEAAEDAGDAAVEANPPTGADKNDTTEI